MTTSPAGSSPESDSPSQDRLAYLGPDRNLWLVSADGSNQERLTEFDEAIGGFDWSPNGQQVAFYKSEGNGTHGVYVYDLRDESLVQLAKGFDAVNVFEPFNWSPDGTKLAFVGHLSRESMLYVVDSDGSDLRELLHAGSMFDARWLPDNRRIVIRSSSIDQMKILVLDTIAGSSTTVFQGSSPAFVSPLLSIYNNKIVFSGAPDRDAYAPNVYFADLTSYELSSLISERFQEEEPYIMRFGSFSPGGDRTICWTWCFDTPSPHGEQRLYTIDLHDGSARLVWSYESPGDDIVGRLEWLSDNSTVVFGISSHSDPDLAGVYAIDVTTEQAMPLAGSVGDERKSINGLDYAHLVDVCTRDDRVLLRGAKRGQIEHMYLMDADGRNLTMVARGHFLRYATFFGWSSDGRMVVEAREPGEEVEVKNVYIIGQEGQVLRKIPDATDPAWERQRLRPR